MPTQILSCGEICVNVGLLDAGCKAVDEDVTIAETGVVGCCTAAQVSVADAYGSTS